MKVEGDSPVPETVAVPLLAAVETLQVSEPAAVSASVALRVGAAHAVGEPSSDIVLETEVPCVMEGPSFTAVTVTFTVITSFREPSETCTTKLSLPEKLALGA